MKYDIAIIGGGPSGYTAALKAYKAGLSVVLFEKDKLGGTCLNRGCIPTKALLKSVNVYKEIQNSSLFGINCDNYSYDIDRIKQRKKEVVDKLRNDLEKTFKINKINIVKGLASINKDLTINCNNELYSADNIIIATGSYPSVVPISGYDLPGVYTSDDLLENDEINFDSLIIIGGGVIACEFASIYLALGKKVTILEMAEHILPTIDNEVAQRLHMYLKKQGAVIETSALVKSISKDENKLTITYANKNKEDRIVSADSVLLATGRKANIAGLFAEGLDIEINKGAIVGDKDGRTNIKNVYVAGDVKYNNVQLAHVAMAQSENIIDLILMNKSTINTDTVPSCVYTNPEIALVGLSENQAKEKGINTICKKYLTGANGKNLIENGENGYLKLVIDSDNKIIIGAQIVASHATDLIGELCVAVANKLTVEQLIRTIHPHPTLCEMISEAAKL